MTDTPAPRIWAPSLTFTQGAHTYTLIHAPGRLTLRACATLGCVIAPLFEGLAAGRGTLDQHLARGAAWLLGSRTLGEDLVTLANMFAPYTTIMGNQPRTLDKCLDEHFAGRVTDMRAWLEHVVDFECGDFLDDARARILEALRPASDEASSASENSSLTGAAKTG